MTCWRGSIRLQNSCARTTKTRDQPTSNPGPGAAAEPRQADSRSFLFFLSAVVAAVFDCRFSSSPPDIGAGMQFVRCPVILALAALALCSPGVSSQLNKDQNQDLDLELRHHRLLQRARSTGPMSQVRGPPTNENAPFLQTAVDRKQKVCNQSLNSTSRPSVAATHLTTSAQSAETAAGLQCSKLTVQHLHLLKTTKLHHHLLHCS